MRLPRELLVGETSWDIEVKREVHWDDPNVEVYGYCDYSLQTITIKSGLPLELKLATFVHEILHALCDEYDIDLPHSLIHRLDIPIARLIIDNFL